MIQAIAPSKLSKFWASQNWTMIWGVIAIVLSWSLTGLIIARLMVYRWVVQKAIGKRFHLEYTSIAAMLAESAGLLSSLGIFFMVTLSVKSPLIAAVPFLLTQIQVSVLSWDMTYAPQLEQWC